MVDVAAHEIAGEILRYVDDEQGVTALQRVFPFGLGFATTSRNRSRWYF